MDSDWKNQEEKKIDIEREMKKSLQEEILDANAIMTLREHLQDKSKEYKDGWWAGWHFSVDYYNENDEIRRNTWKEYLEKRGKIYTSADEKLADPNYYQKRDALRRQVAAIIKQSVQKLFN
jgi:hypothetical protein